MKGILLAGGTGSRLDPLTRVTNKHLLPVYNKPMIYYPIETLKKLDCEEVLIISGGNHLGDITRLLEDGSYFDMKFKYAVQTKPDGIAGALSLAEDFIHDDKSFYTILGDNIFLSDTKKTEKEHAIYVQQVKDAYRFGTYFRDKNLIIEKPKGINKGLCVTGLYKFTSIIFDYIKKLSPSNRGELEITDVNNYLLEVAKSKNNMDVLIVKNWYDAGTFSSLLRASKQAQKMER